MAGHAAVPREMPHLAFAFQPAVERLRAHRAELPGLVF